MTGASGWFLGVLGFLSICASCGGHARLDSSGGGATGGSGGTDAADAAGARGGSGGSAGSGGSGGSTAIDAASASCECPEADFGIEIVPNGARLTFTPPVAGAECAGGPLRGQARDVCGSISLQTSACATRDGGKPCLELSPQEVKYVDANGTVFLGSMVEIHVDQTGTFSDPAKILAGSYSARLTSEGSEMTIGGRFVLCGFLVRSLIPC